MYVPEAFLMSPSEAVFSTPSTFKPQMPARDASQARQAKGHCARIRRECGNAQLGLTVFELGVTGQPKVIMRTRYTDTPSETK